MIDTNKYVEFFAVVNISVWQEKSDKYKCKNCNNNTEIYFLCMIDVHFDISKMYISLCKSVNEELIQKYGFCMQCALDVCDNINTMIIDNTEENKYFIYKEQLYKYKFLPQMFDDKWINIVNCGVTLLSHG